MFSEQGPKLTEMVGLFGLAVKRKQTEIVVTE